MLLLPTEGVHGGPGVPEGLGDRPPVVPTCPGHQRSLALERYLHLDFGDSLTLLVVRALVRVQAAGINERMVNDNYTTQVPSAASPLLLRKNIFHDSAFYISTTM